MAIEIERKFLLKGNDYRDLAKGIYYHQGYLSSNEQRIVRVRIIGNRGYIAIKEASIGAARLEFEYEIPFSDANEILLKLCEKPNIEKYRYKVQIGNLVWEVDEFHGDNKGLIIAEIELNSEDQTFEKPSWIGEEVTGDPKYYNVNLVKKPFNTWQV